MLHRQPIRTRQTARADRRHRRELERRRAGSGRYATDSQQVTAVIARARACPRCGTDMHAAYGPRPLGDHCTDCSGMSDAWCEERRALA